MGESSAMLMHKLVRIIVVAGVCLLIPLPSSASEIDIYILDVGQGDSTLIISPLNHKILIDGGPNGLVAEQLEEVLPFWDRKIDVIMLTHPDADHVSGVVDVVQRYDVDKILLTPAKGDNSGYRALNKQLAELKIQSMNFLKGQKLHVPGGLTFISIWPPSDSKWNDPQNTNELSQVVQLNYKEFSMLFTGDIDTQIANHLNDGQSFSDIDALKVPHHGSKYGLNSIHLQTLTPLISTISAGADNRFGHPAPGTIERLKGAGSQVYRTDRHGRIHIQVSSSGISVFSEGS